MGYLIDTNVLSELQKGSRCHPGVQAWYAATDSGELFLSVLVIGGIRRGIENLHRRDAPRPAVLNRNYGRWKPKWPGASCPSPRPSPNAGDA